MSLQMVAIKDHFATKEDLSRVEGQLSREIVAAEGRLNEKITAAEGQLNEKIAELRADLERDLRRMTWQLIGALLVGLTALGAIIKLLP